MLRFRVLLRGSDMEPLFFVSVGGGTVPYANAIYLFACKLAIGQTQN